MVGTVFLIRHGETEGDGERRYKGTIDVPLSERGVAQAESAAKFVKEYLDEAGQTLHAVYCSDLIRSRKSAEPVAFEFGLTPQPVQGFRERSFGQWEGMTFDEIAGKWPDAFNDWASNPLKFSPMGGETTLEVKERVLHAFDETCVVRARPRNMAIVAHGGVNRVLLCYYLGMPYENIFRIEQDYSCVNIVEFHEGFPVVKILNGGPRT
jgi:alpha-ribazole phosphatase